MEAICQNDKRPPAFNQQSCHKRAAPGKGGGGRDGGELLDKSDGMLVVSLRGVNRRF